ncbi:MAG: hypothetical protein GTO71_06665 [Woeseiaceae bacterium]|nr:hypothetical protein [Woeseiaceae bacterium]NIP20777.1 hypothetical protein [Woeseiaceae bacterium]NIS89570.1 hypothetical protein [Woeseiaceae bacterium]
MKNKTILFAVIGVVVGGVAGVLVNSEQMDMYTMAAIGGVVGFLVGWVLQSRSKASED